MLATYLFKTFQGCNTWQEYKRKTTEQEDNDIVYVLKQNYDVPLRDITNKIALGISTTTLHCGCSEAGLESYIAMKKPDLSSENIHKRLDWAIKYKD